MGETNAWESYEAWNAAVLDVVFPEVEVPQPVYLDFEDEVVQGLSTRMGVPANQVETTLCEVVAATLRRGGPAAIFALHMARLRVWARAGRSSPPPFAALLAAFCVAAERMAADDGMSSANYFGRLRSALGWDSEDHRLDQAYRRVAERLWGELNRWLLELDGERGLPTAFALNHRFVGLTVSQALVRTADREKLREFFRQYGFAPGSDVAPSELVPLLDGWLAQRPCPVSSSFERLWSKGQARERISQAAAVALASWDGRVRDRGSGRGGATDGHLLLSLELGGFPRRRFALQAVIYLQEPVTARHATIATATPATQVELVPDLPGALGLGRGSSLHAGDVLEGVLRIEDSLTEATVERRPRRLVIFREDELSHRWIESPQVMLGENLRLLAHESLKERLADVLREIARPGWAQLEPYPGQPDGWVVFGGVEVFNHPGQLVSTQRMDDLAPLVPLTTSQLKVTGGFSLPGRVRGKWHSWAPPEIRAVSDASEGFVVRLIDTNRFAEQGDDGEVETLLEEWDDDGSGVVVRPLAGLDLEDGDYRVELVPRGANVALTSTTILLRSGDTPDRHQWALLETASYGPGLGVLGLAGGDERCSTRGHVVVGAQEISPVETTIPQEPRWKVGASSSSTVGSVVRLTMPDSESCLYTGRHREVIETVPTDSRGKPLQAWAHGRCSGCGLVRRYPTRLRSRWSNRAEQKSVEQPRRHDLSRVVARPRRGRDWSTAFDALLHTGGGSWSQLERIAFQIEPTALFLDELARSLEVLGHVDVRRNPSTLEPMSWEVAPSSLAGTEDGLLFSGYWPSGLYASIGGQLEDAGAGLSVVEQEDGPSSYFADCSGEVARKLLSDRPDDLPVVDLAWLDLVGVLPPLSEVLLALPRQSDALVGDLTWFQPRDNSWSKVESLDAPGAYRVRRFSTTDVVRTAEDVDAGLVARSTVQLGKHLAALMTGCTLMAYDSSEKTLVVPLGADLPGLYGRAVVAASGAPPAPVLSQRLLRYENVPKQLASHLYDLFSK